MTALRNRLLASVFAISIIIPLAPRAHADLPVIDFSSLFQQITSYVTQVKQWVQEQTSWFTQLQQLQHELQTDFSTAQMLAGFVQNPSLGSLMGIMGMLGLTNDLPINPYSLLSLTSGYGNMSSLSGIIGTGSAKLSMLTSLVPSTYDADKVYSCPTATTSFGCTQSDVAMRAASTTKGVLATMVSQLQDHMQVLNQARTQLESASDPATRENLQAVVQTETAYMTNVSGQIQAVNGIAAAQQAIIQQQGDQRVRSDFAGMASQLGGTP